MTILSKSFINTDSSDTVLISWVFLRGLAVIYFSAFASLAIQIEGLVGANGILPIASKLAVMDQFYQHQKYWQMPTIFWLNASDSMLVSVCYAGMLAAGLLMINVFNRAALIICFVLYLSVLEAGQDFTRFQWDALLLEAGFLAIFLTWGSGIIILLYRWLLARFMFMGGLVKIASGDPSWENLTALSFHYQTQPLPTPIAYYAYHLPAWFHKLCVGGVLFIELVVPFFVFLPRRFRIFACIAFVILQSGIILTGNYTFFNLLTILLCVFLLQDRDVARIMPNRLISFVHDGKSFPGLFANTFASLWASVVMLICASHIWLFHINMPLFTPLNSLLRATSTFFLVNNYGPFAVMTTTRNEIVIQGSNDALNWSDYQFKYKPGKLTAELGWNIPYQPRLDWQMWFEALDPVNRSAWFNHFLLTLLQGSPQVLALLADNPFPVKPPSYIRAILYRYSYTSQQQRNNTGQIWQRDDYRVYSPIKTLELTMNQYDNSVLPGSFE